MATPGNLHPKPVLLCFVNEKDKSKDKDNKPLPTQQPLREGVDYYTERGRLVFTEAYHLKRGFCCGSGCRHCPYLKKTQEKSGNDE
jgi:hypothetical protein